MSLKLVFVHCAFLCFKETEEQLPQILKQAEMNVTNREETKKNRESGKNPEGKPTNSASPHSPSRYDKQFYSPTFHEVYLLLGQ